MFNGELFCRRHTEKVIAVGAIHTVGTVHHERRPCVEQTHVLQLGEWKAKLKHLSRTTLPLPFNCKLGGRFLVISLASVPVEASLQSATMRSGTSLLIS